MCLRTRYYTNSCVHCYGYIIIIPVLCFYDFKNKKITLKKVIMINMSYRMAAFSDIIKYNGVLYLVPNNSDAFVKYEIDNDRFIYIYMKTNMCNRYRNGYIYDKKIFI